MKPLVAKTLVAAATLVGLVVLIVLRGNEEPRRLAPPRSSLGDEQMLNGAVGRSSLPELVVPVPWIVSRAASPCAFSPDAAAPDAAAYEVFPDLDINMGMDLNHTSLAADGQAAPGVPMHQHPCTRQCDEDLRCGAVVVRGSDCWFKRAPFFSVGTAAKTTTLARKDMLGQFVHDQQFNRRMAFGMIVRDPSFLPSAVAAALSTWLCDFDVLLLCAHQHQRDVMELEAQRMLQALQGKCRRRSKVVQLVSPPGADPTPHWEELVATHLLVRAFPLRDWYMVIQHDTFVFTHNLNLELSTFRNPMETMVYGSVAFNGSMWHPANGFGIVMSEKAARIISDRHSMCLTPGGSSLACSSQPFGCCMNAHRIPLASLPSLWSRSPFLAVGADRRMDHAAFPTSFHQMSRMEWTYDLTSWSAGVLSDLAASCTPSSAYAKTQMCVLYSLQQQHCTKGGRGRSGGGGGVALSVPLTWDVLAHHLKVEQQHDPELFQREIS